MSLGEIRRFIRANPFRPFRVHNSDGSHYDVHHRDFIILSKLSVEIGVMAHDPEDIPDRLVSCDPLHITRIDPIANGKRSNGRKSKP